METDEAGGWSGEDARDGDGTAAAAVGGGGETGKWAMDRFGEGGVVGGSENFKGLVH